MTQKAKRSLKSWLGGKKVYPSSEKVDGGTLGSLVGLGYIKREGKIQDYTITEAGEDWVFGMDRKV